MRVVGLAVTLLMGCGGGKRVDTAGDDRSLAAWGECDVVVLGLEIGGGIALAVPPADGKNISSNTPIVMFMDTGTLADSIDPATIEVHHEGGLISGTVQVMSSGRALVFVADRALPTNAGITVTIGESGSYEFHTAGFEAVPANDANLSFEREATGHGPECDSNVFTENFITYGDTAISDVATGSVDATEGDYRLLMSTGEVLGGAALNRASSFIVSQPFETHGATSLAFDFRFVSEELGGDGQDDSLVLVLRGPLGVIFEEVVSVASVVDSGAVPYPGLSGARGGDWTTHTVAGLDAIGSPVGLTLILTDAAGTDGTTGIAVDDIRMD
jgi:hypothetical protein